MIFRLRPDWQKIITRAWSVRLMLLTAVLSGVATGLAIAQPYLGVNPLLLAAVIGLATTTSSVIAIYARVVKQQGF